MIDITQEKPITLGAAAELAGVHVNSVNRWVNDGIRSATGQVVRLEGVRVGGGWRTSVEAVQRFMKVLTERALSDAPA